MRAFETGDPRWMTYQQAREKRWQVRKGARSTTIFFTKSYEVEDEVAEDETKTVRILRHYAVFHASQIEGIPAYEAPTLEEVPRARPEASDLILRNSGAVRRGNRRPRTRRGVTGERGINEGRPGGKARLCRESALTLRRRLSA